MFLFSSVYFASSKHLLCRGCNLWIDFDVSFLQAADKSPLPSKSSPSYEENAKKEQQLMSEENAKEEQQPMSEENSKTEQQRLKSYLEVKEWNEVFIPAYLLPIRAKRLVHLLTMENYMALSMGYVVARKLLAIRESTSGLIISLFFGGT